MLPGELFGDVLETEYAWLGARGASPSVKVLNGTPVAWNPVSGIEREVDQLWSQDTPPPPGTHYAWLGEPHESVSVRLDDDGNIIARNLSRNASFEQGPQFVHPTSATLSISTWDDIVLSGTNALQVDLTSDGNIRENVEGVFEGEWLAVSIPLRFGGGDNRVRLRIIPLNENGGWLSPNPLSPAERLPWSYQAVTYALQMPPGAAGAQVWAYFYANQDSPTRWYSDEWYFAVADSESAALAQVETYFDGDAPDDRENDLWYDADGVPHEWVNGEGWVEADDRLTPVPDNFLRLPIDTSFTGDTPDVYRTQDDTVRQYTSRILVNGVQREADTWSVDRELQGDLPKQVAAVSGVTQATGTIAWTPSHVVSEHSPNPWNANGGWVPSRGDRVEILVSDGVNEWKRFHGLIDITRGDVGSGFTSTIIDDYDKLSAEVSHIAMTSIMPPTVPGGEGPWRNIGIHPLYYVDLALRQSGFYTTPPREHNSLLYVPLQGSLWPHYGTLVETGDDTDSYGGGNRVTPWGLGKGNFTAFYSPAAAPNMSSTVQVSFMVAQDHGSATDIFLDYGPTNFLRISISSSRTVTVQRGSTAVTSLSLNSSDSTVSVLFKNGQATIRTDTNRESSGGFSSGGSGMSQIRVNAGTNASIAGFQVSRPEGAGREHISTRFAPSARFDTTSLRLAGGMPAAPNIENVTAANLIEQINDSIIAALWIDETGVMQWAQSDTLRRRSSVKTVTTADDIFSLSWEAGLLQSASRVTVEGKQPSITRSRWRTTTVAENSGSETLRSGDALEIFFEAGTDEDWILPSFQFTEVGGESGIWGSFNFNEYGMVGLYFESDGEEITGPVNYRTTITTHRLGNQKTLIKYVAGNWPSDVEGILKTPPEDVTTTLWLRNRDQPVVRQKAFGKIEWYDDRISVTGVSGPGPELVHDVGVWSATARIGSEGTNYWERIGDYIQSQVTVPQPVVRGVSIAPDPRLQLADVISIHSDLVGATLSSLITGFSESFDDSGYHQTLDVRVLTAQTTAPTYAAFDEKLLEHPLTYQQFQALGPLPQTYEEFNATP